MDIIYNYKSDFLICSSRNVSNMSSAFYNLHPTAGYNLLSRGFAKPGQISRALAYPHDRPSD